MNKSVLYILLLTVFLFFLSGCKKKVRPTTMVIKDSVRHYYPIKQGQQLDIMFTITNTGDAPLVISDIQPSCGCIILDKSSHIIIPEEGIRQFKATYNSIKNIGEVVPPSSDTQIAEERRNLFSLPDFLRELSVTH